MFEERGGVRAGIELSYHSCSRVFTLSFDSAFGGDGGVCGEKFRRYFCCERSVFLCYFRLLHPTPPPPRADNIYCVERLLNARVTTGLPAAASEHARIGAERVAAREHGQKVDEDTSWLLFVGGLVHYYY